MELIGIDYATGEDKTVETIINLVNGSRIEIIPCDNNNIIRGKRSEIMLVADKEYDKYLKRVENRHKLYLKKKKLGRKI